MIDPVETPALARQRLGSRTSEQRTFEMRDHDPRAVPRSSSMASRRRAWAVYCLAALARAPSPRARRRRRAWAVYCLAALGAIVSAACSGAPQRSPSSMADASPFSPPAVRPASGHTRVQVTVVSCVPVGFGLSCSCEVDGPDPGLRGSATLEACVGSGDAIGLTTRLDTGPIVDSHRPPLALWMDVHRTRDSERYCGVLMARPGGAHFRVVDFER